MPATIESITYECKSCPIPLESKKDLCSICIAQKVIRGKWTLLIIWKLKQGKMRFSQILKEIPQIKQGPLTMQLKELVELGLVHRQVHNEIPPKVEYSLTKRGEEFLKVMNVMDIWGKEYFSEMLQPNMIQK